jgi:glyoxylase-like metal-dependent hydrolase (beta-lactamase superfamily II)
MIVEHFPVGMLQCTCTIVADETSREAIVVDGGDDVDEIASRLEARGLRVTYLVHTHAHFDHIGALGPLRERIGGDALLHPGDLPLYAALAEQSRWVGMAGGPQPVPIDGDLRDGDELPIGEHVLRVLHTPGHTPGSVTFALDEPETPAVLLTGDTLFRGAIGRWDLGGTSQADIVRSIREKILPYADATLVVPGHGPFSTVGRERAENPYLAGRP